MKIGFESYVWIQAALSHGRFLLLHRTYKMRCNDKEHTKNVQFEVYMSDVRNWYNLMLLGNISKIIQLVG